MSPIDVAARFIFLNKTCFNGLYRVNRKGQFNVSFGRPAKGTPTICDADNLRSISAYLNENNIHIECRPYDWIGKSVIKNDLVYIDPPYLPDPGKTSFTNYTPFKFTHEDHTRLVKFAEKLIKRNAQVAISNSYNDASVELLDPSFWSVHQVQSSRSVSCSGSSRGKVLELLATSW
jgi:DNA adenine methylase